MLPCRLIQVTRRHPRPGAPPVLPSGNSAGAGRTRTDPQAADHCNAPRCPDDGLRMAGQATRAWRSEPLGRLHAVPASAAASLLANLHARAEMDAAGRMHCTPSMTGGTPETAAVTGEGPLPRHRRPRAPFRRNPFHHMVTRTAGWMPRDSKTSGQPIFARYTVATGSPRTRGSPTRELPGGGNHHRPVRT